MQKVKTMNKRKMIYLDDAIEAVHKRIDVLLGDPVFKRKRGDIDLYGVIPLLCDLPSDDRLWEIANLVGGSISHFELDDAMDLLYQIKDVIGER